jgi:hypothetical protein
LGLLSSLPRSCSTSAARSSVPLVAAVPRSDLIFFACLRLHLASLAASPALNAATFVAVHLAADLPPEPREYFLLRFFLAIQVLLCRNEGNRPACNENETFNQTRWRVRQADEDEVDAALLGLGTEEMVRPVSDCAPMCN